MEALVSMVTKLLTNRLILIGLFVIAIILYAITILPNYFQFRTARPWDMQIINDVDEPVIAKRLDNQSEATLRLNPGDIYIAEDDAYTSDLIFGDFAYIGYGDEGLNKPDVIIGFFTEDMRPLGQVAIPILSFTHLPVVVCASMAAEPPAVLPVSGLARPTCQSQGPASHRAVTEPVLKLASMH